MSIWTTVTTSFYIYECADNTYERLRSFMRDNEHLLPKGSEEVFDFDIKKASFRTGIRCENGNRIEIYGAAQIHMFGNLRDMDTEETMNKFMPFIKKLRTAFDMRLGQVLLDDGFNLCSIQIKQYDKDIKINLNKVI